jgi:hypothetical protein
MDASITSISFKILTICELLSVNQSVARQQQVLLGTNGTEACKLCLTSKKKKSEYMY